eukprot:7232373-Alexandrium_andersonii.AAC.1
MPSDPPFFSPGVRLTALRGVVRRAGGPYHGRDVTRAKDGVRPERPLGSHPGVRRVDGQTSRST